MNAPTVSAILSVILALTNSSNPDVAKKAKPLQQSS